MTNKFGSGSLARDYRLQFFKTIPYTACTEQDEMIHG